MSCIICRKALNTKRPALYCSQACTQRAYRRRRAQERIDAAVRAQKAAEHARRAAWTRLLRDEVKLSGTQAQQVYNLLDRLGVVNELPWEQLTIDG